MVRVLIQALVILLAAFVLTLIVESLSRRDLDRVNILHLMLEVSDLLILVLNEAS